MGTGGSRYGAGRLGWRRKCEYSLPFDIRLLHRQRLLVPGARFSWQWFRDAKQYASISVAVGLHSLTLSYQWTSYGGLPEAMDCHVTIEKTPCNLGGFRYWFICPECDRHCALLYGGTKSGNFGCRVCEQLAYASETEDRMSRLWRKQRKIEAKLNDDDSKPKWMRLRTYDRFCERLNEIEEKKDIQFAIGALSILQRTGLTIDEILR